MRLAYPVRWTAILVASLSCAVRATDPPQISRGLQIADATIAAKNQFQILNARLSSQLSELGAVTENLKEMRTELWKWEADIQSLSSDDRGRKLASDQKLTSALSQYVNNQIVSIGEAENKLQLLQPIREFLESKRNETLTADKLNEALKASGIDELKNWVGKFKPQIDERAKWLDTAIHNTSTLPAPAQTDPTLSQALFDCQTKDLIAIKLTPPPGLDAETKKMIEDVKKNVAASYALYQQFLRSQNQADLTSFQNRLAVLHDESKRKTEQAQGLFNELKVWPAGALDYFRAPAYSQPDRQGNDRSPVSLKAIISKGFLDENQGPHRMSLWIHGKTNDRPSISSLGVIKIGNGHPTGAEKAPYIEVIRTINTYGSTMVDLGLLSN